MYAFPLKRIYSFSFSFNYLLLRVYHLFKNKQNTFLSALTSLVCLHHNFDYHLICV